MRRGLPAAYSAVSRLVPVSGRSDELETLYPFYGPRQPALRLTSVGADISERTSTRRRSLRARSVTAGQARLAIRSGTSAPAESCIYCGQCLNGCVYEHIWSADFLLRDLARGDRISVLHGYAISFSEEQEGVVVSVLSGDRLQQVRGKRLFVAAGALATAHLLQQSRIVDGPILVRDNQTIFLPLVFVNSIGSPRLEPSYTLSQVFVRLEAAAGDPLPSQIQLYTYNPTLLARARSARPILSYIPEALLEWTLRRMVIGICYLHSDRSAQIEVTRPAEGRLRLRPVGTFSARNAARVWMRRLPAALSPLRLFPLSFLADVTPPGTGFHIGASMPMTQTFSGRRIETDLLGRPPGISRTHIVDSSVLPSLPAGPLTYTSMANAWRIATESSRIP